MEILLNGKTIPLLSLNQTLSSLLLELHLESKHGLVIELNRKIILAKDYQSTPVKDADEIEILTMVDGG
jgi:thiamine biosynthesis protein ThiS